MSQGVNKLKELLFEPENRAIADLEHAIERVSKTEAGHRADITKRLDAAFSRSGTEDRFRASVAETLDGALRDAEVVHHNALSDAIAPLVVRTIKTEITNSTDELAEALYPMTGRMVKQYVASAIKDLTNQINRSLERNPVMLRLNSLLTGRSVAELALADAQALNVEELYLIRRGSGELVARWPKDNASSNRDQVMSGILTAINEFATEAFSSKAEALRQIDLGDSQIYLRGSPTYLLAAKCTGTANLPIEQSIDEEFLSAIETHLELTDKSSDASDQNQQNSPETVLPNLAQRLTTRITTYYEDHAAAGGSSSPVKALMWIIGLALAAWLSWTCFDAYLTHRTQSKATYVVKTNKEMAGFPTKIETASFGSAVTIEGLAPSKKVKLSLIDGIRALLPTTQINERIGVVDTDFPDHRPELSKLQQKIEGITTRVTNLNSGVTDLTGYVTGIENGLGGVKTGVNGITSRLQTLDDHLNRQAISRATTRAIARLSASAPDLTRLSQNLDNEQAISQVEKARTTIKEILPRINAQRVKVQDPGLAGGELAKLQTELTSIAAIIDRSTKQITPALAFGTQPEHSANATIEGSPPQNLIESAETLALKAEHFATHASAASQASLMKAPPPIKPTARERLESWTRANAIFFSNGENFADSRKADKKLKSLARLSRNTGMLIRVVGFTDEKGAQSKNSTLSLARAEKVRRVLIANGIPASRIRIAGRKDTKELSRSVGEQSPNRRVQFELGFIGEPGQ